MRNGGNPNIKDRAVKTLSVKNKKNIFSENMPELGKYIIFSKIYAFLQA